MLPFIVSRKDNEDVSYMIISDVTKEGEYIAVDDDGKLSRIKADEIIANYLFDNFAPVPIEEGEAEEETKD